MHCDANIQKQATLSTMLITQKLLTLFKYYHKLPPYLFFFIFTQFYLIFWIKTKLIYLCFVRIYQQLENWW